MSSGTVLDILVWKFLTADHITMSEWYIPDGRGDSSFALVH